MNILDCDYLSAHKIQYESRSVKLNIEIEYNPLPICELSERKKKNHIEIKQNYMDCGIWQFRAPDTVRYMVPELFKLVVF